MRPDRTSAITDSLHDLDDVVLTVDEAARVLRISRGLAFTAVREGTIPSLRIGRRILIPRQALEQLIGGRDTAPDQ